ncbi:hypothetical protein [Streptomyces sp. UNOB3_S3]|uniref:hypothetical protein n=1 Tax=Streptomyces sp. UNOB3_S3 TaxID=2871682 RepID=UPI001E4254CA|nr:hypothetical protein [Streptomyces sp. UNOB3_S3]MCC3773313.1 hypothetical protein [Streptomyces sp. UNOB3_S3]
MTNTGTAPLTSAKVTVTLPAGRGLGWGLGWGVPGIPDYQLNVLDVGEFRGTLSPIGNALTFENVVLNLAPGESRVMWVAVSARAGEPEGYTALTFDVGGMRSFSAPIHIKTPQLSSEFWLLPWESEVLLSRGGAVGEVGVIAVNVTGELVGKQTVEVTLPTDTRLVWGRPDRSDHLPAVITDNCTTTYPGSLSDDKQTLTFDNVELVLPDLGSQSALWVAVRAARDAPPVVTSLMFYACGKAWASGPVQVAPEAV